MSDLANMTTEDIEVQSVATSPNPSIGTKEFADLLNKEFSGDKVWRSSHSLAKKLNVDVVELDNYLRKQKALCSRVAKDEGVFLYAFTDRVGKTEEKAEARKAQRPLVDEEDRYTIAYLHNSLHTLELVLKKYALKIHERNSEAFSQFVEAKNRLEAGIVLYGQKIKADMTKLI